MQAYIVEFGSGPTSKLEDELREHGFVHVKKLERSGLYQYCYVGDHKDLERHIADLRELEGIAAIEKDRQTYLIK